MSRTNYTEEQKNWIRYYSQSERWENTRAFTKAFNDKFGLNIAYKSFACYLQRHGIKINAESMDALYTEEQAQWIRDNLSSGVFKDQKHFTDTFNAIFGTNKGYNTMAVYLYSNGLKLSTYHNRERYTDEQKEWLKENCDKYETFQDVVDEFNDRFGVDVSYGCLISYCKRNGWHTQGKSTDNNRGQWKKGEARILGECPIGTIKWANGKPYIKVQMYDGKSHIDRGSHHGFKEPYWKPLQKKIWEDHYGEMPKGFVVCSLNGDRADENIKNIGAIDKRMTGIMGKNGWWTDNSVLTGDGVQWCNLYAVAKDHNVL